MSRFRLAFSRSESPCVDFRFPVIYGSFTVDALLSLCTCCRYFFPAAGVSVLICSYLIPHEDQDYLYPSNFATFANFAIGLDLVVIQCIIIVHIFPFIACCCPFSSTTSRPFHAIIDLSSASAVTRRHVIDRYAEKIYEYTFSKLGMRLSIKPGVRENNYRDPKTLPTLFLTAPVSS